MSANEIAALEIEEVVETAKVVEKPKKTATKKTAKKEEVIETVETEKKTGNVVNCQFLRVRKEPKVGDNVIKEIPVGTNVAILGEAENEFYHVVTQDGDEGFCMKEFIK